LSTSHVQEPQEKIAVVSTEVETIDVAATAVAAMVVKDQIDINL
jgi:hypothetical protein